jgi:hypothetical protein
LFPRSNLVVTANTSGKNILAREVVTVTLTVTSTGVASFCLDDFVGREFLVVKSL